MSETEEKAPPAPEQIAWIPKPEPRRWTRREKYVADPQDDHVDALTERVRADDLHVAETVLLPVLAELGGLASETEIAKTAEQNEEFVRRRLMTLWRTQRKLVYNAGDGWWETAGHRMRKAGHD